MLLFLSLLWLVVLLFCFSFTSGTQVHGQGARLWPLLDVVHLPAKTRCYLQARRAPAPICARCLAALVQQDFNLGRPLRHRCVHYDSAAVDVQFLNLRFF